MILVGALTQPFWAQSTAAPSGTTLPASPPAEPAKPQSPLPPGQVNLSPAMPVANAAVNGKSASISAHAFGPLTQSGLVRFEQWLPGAVRRHYFIQLLSSDAGNTAEIEGFLERALNQQLDPEALRVYRSALSGRDRIGIIYGDYPSREAASLAMRGLPAAIRQAQPYPRQIEKLQP